MNMFGSKHKPIDTTQIETIIGKDTSFQGTIEVKGTIRVDGKFEGQINSNGDIIIGENGEVKAQIQARNALIAGTLQGNISITEKLELLSTGKLYGDIDAAVLSIGEGAIFRGACTMKGEITTTVE